MGLVAPPPQGTFFQPRIASRMTGWGFRVYVAGSALTMGMLFYSMFWVNLEWPEERVQPRRLRYYEEGEEESK